MVTLAEAEALHGIKINVLPTLSATSSEIDSSDEEHYEPEDLDAIGEWARPSETEFYSSSNESEQSLSSYGIAQAEPRPLIPNNGDIIERVQEWVDWCDGKGPLVEQLQDWMSWKEGNGDLPSSTGGTTPIWEAFAMQRKLATRISIDAKKVAFGHWLRAQGPWDVVRHQSPPACIKNHVLEKTWWENADLYFPIYGTPESQASFDPHGFLPKHRAFSECAPVHKLTVVIKVEYSNFKYTIDGWEGIEQAKGPLVHDIPLEKLFRLFFALGCVRQSLDIKVVFGGRGMSKKRNHGLKHLYRSAPAALGEPLLMMIDWVLADVPGFFNKDGDRDLKNMLKFYRIDLAKGAQADLKKVEDAPDHEREEMGQKILAKYLGKYVQENCKWRRSPAKQYDYLRHIFKQAFPEIKWDGDVQTEPYYGELEVDMDKWLLIDG